MINLNIFLYFNPFWGLPVVFEDRIFLKFITQISTLKQVIQEVFFPKEYTRG